MAVSRRQLLTLGAGATALATAGALSHKTPSLTFVAHADPALDAPPPAMDVLALQRLANGPSVADLASVRQLGLKGYIAEQLEPPADDGPIVAAKLQELTYPLSVPVTTKAANPPERTGRRQPLGRSGNQRQGRPEYETVADPLEWWNAPLSERWRLHTEGGQYDRALQRRPGQEMRVVSVVRGLYSPWQLREVLVEFWHNHFNIDLEADRRIPLVFPDFDATLRQHALGNFRELLEATAASPAMLYYLNNAASKASPANENYARELFELHTLGEAHYLNRQYRRWDEVPGALAGKPVGYVDEDVYEAARAFTGWTVADGGGLNRQARQGAEMPNTGRFYYHAAWHDPYQKRVLGVALDPNQPPLADGRQVLDLLAVHPATARFVCTKLVRRLVADDPPGEVVEAAVSTWESALRSPHQLRDVVRTIVSHPRFLQGWGAKVKTPREFTLAYLRGIGAEFAPSPGLFRQWEQLGYRQFSFPAPTGHPDVAGYWLSTNGMLGRWNLLLATLQPRFGIAADAIAALTPADARTPQAQVRFWSRQLLGTELSPPGQQVLLQALSQGARGNTDPQRLLTLLIAMTPAFQRR